MDVDDSVPELEVAEDFKDLRLHQALSSGVSLQQNGTATGSDTAENVEMNGADEGDSGDDDDDDDMDEIIEAEPAKCLFCPEFSAAPRNILDHCTQVHGFDLALYVSSRRLPTEDIIKVVSFLRQNPLRECTSSVVDAKRDTWRRDQWMSPGDPNDHGIVSALIWDWDVPEEPGMPFPQPSTSQNGGYLSSLKEENTDLKRKASDDARRNRDSVRHREEEKDERNHDYFDGYSGFNIHCEMLRDRVRTEAYQLALNEVAKDKVVLDIGCGSGVLSCFAAKAGAKKVIGVDKADIIDFAHSVAQDNGLAEKIRFVHADLDSTRLDIDEVDVIVSEWMGYFLLFEGMLDSVVSARNKYLSKSGTMIPSTANMYLYAHSDPDDYHKRVGMWDNAYGLQFHCLKDHSLRYPAVEVMDPEKVITDRALLRHLDLMRCSVGDLEFEVDVVLTASKTCQVTSLIGCFDVGFTTATGENKLMLCTSPYDPATHWAQSAFYLYKPFPVTQNDRLLVNMKLRKSREDHRGLDVSFRMRIDGQPDGPEWRQYYIL